MAEVGATASESGSDTDKEFDPSADMLVHDYDDEHTLDEEEETEMDSGGDSTVNELDSLQKEGEMPLEDLLAMYGYDCAGSSVIPAHETQSSSSEEILCKQDLTLDKDEIARDLLIDEENKSHNSSPMDAECVVPDYITASSSTALLLEDVNESAQDGQSSRLLRSVSHQSRYSGSETDEDEDYLPAEEEEMRKVIQVGHDYQAVVPEGLCKYDDAPAYENDDKLLWDPRVISYDEVDKYLLEVQQLSQANQRTADAIVSGNHCSEDEQCLYLLLQCGYNIEEALRRKRIQGAAAVADSMSLWSEEECRSFEIGLKTYGKDFNMIQQHKVKTRSVAELVNFYYLWKKTERHDMFANKSRLEKKKYSLHPGTTDYMDRFLDDQENPQQSGHHRDRSSSPNINSLIYGDHKRQQHNRTPTYGGSNTQNSPSSPQPPPSENNEAMPNLVQFTTTAPTTVPSLLTVISTPLPAETHVTNNAVLEQIATSLSSEINFESLSKFSSTSTSTTTSPDFSTIGTTAISAAITSLSNNNMSSKVHDTNNSFSSQQAESILNSIAMSVTSVSPEGPSSLTSLNHDKSFKCSTTATESAAR